MEDLLFEAERQVLRMLSRSVPPAEADELAQETFVRAFVALQRGERPEHPVGWVLGIARNVLLESLRRRTYERRLHERLAIVMGPEWQLPHESVDRRLVIAEALDALPEDLRGPVIMHHLGSVPVREVARHLSISEGAVRTRLWRARNVLRVALEDVEEVAVVSSEREPSIAARARSLAERPPLIEWINVGFVVGGERFPVAPMSAPAFPPDGLSVEQMQFAIERMHAVRVGGDRPLTGRMTMWAAPDPFEHPQPATVWRLALDGEVGNEAQRGTAADWLVPTEGWRIGTDTDWRPMLEEVAGAGLKMAWFTLLGLEATHDALCGRVGAFRAIVAAMERCADAGIQPGGQVVVSTRNARQLPELVRLVQSKRTDGAMQVPVYVDPWSPYNVSYEVVRPEPEDVPGVRPPGDDWLYDDFWSDPAAHTEGSFTREAPEGTSSKTDPPRMDLLVDRQLDLHVGTQWFGPLHRVANLRRDAPEQIYERLATLEPSPPLPADADLARRYGEPSSRKLYMSRTGLVRKWLAAWREELALPYLGWF